jgi:glycosyltransferase involved in cell wall biosynthesis
LKAVAGGMTKPQEVRRAIYVATVPNTIRAFLLPYAGYFRQRGWQIDAAASDLPDCRDCCEAFDNVFDLRFNRSLVSWRNVTDGCRSVADLVRKGRYDLVHVHSPIASALTRLTLRNSRGKPDTLLVYTAHGFHFFNGNSKLKNFVFYQTERLAARWTDYLFTINQEDYSAALRFGTIPRERVLFTSGIGVDLGRYGNRSQTNQSTPALALPPRAKYVLVVAEFIKRKRPWDAIRALSLISDPTVHLVMAGDGPLLDSMRSLARKLSVSDRVHFLGFRTDIPELLHEAALLLLPSSQEGLPRCIMEAFCAKVPVIATNIRGSRDMIAPDAGLLVDVGSPAQIAAGIQRLLNDETMRAKMIAKGKEKLRDYSFEAIVPAYEKIYAEGSRRN